MNTVKDIQVKTIQCKIERVKMYEIPGAEEYADKTPVLELTFKPIAGTGATGTANPPFQVVNYIIKAS